jgi:hypothetical protein
VYLKIDALSRGKRGWVSHRFSEPALLAAELWQLNGIAPQMLWLDSHSA